MALGRGDVDYVEDPHTAARLLLELKRQARDNAQPEGIRKEAVAALNKLTRAWPDAPHVAATASDDDLGGLGAPLKRERDLHRQQQGQTAQSARAERQRQQRRESGHDRPTPAPKTPKTAGPKAQRTAPARPTRRTTRAPKRRGGGLLSGVTDAALAPTAGWGQLVVQILGATVFFSVLYALLRNDRGGRAVETFSKGTVKVVQAIVDPSHDPLAPRLSAGGALGQAGDAVNGVVTALQNAKVPAPKAPAKTPAPRTRRPGDLTSNVIAKRSPTS